MGYEDLVPTLDAGLVRALAWHALSRTGGFDATSGQRMPGAVPLVYVDKNPWGRHLDDQSVARNAVEATAFARLKELLDTGRVRLAYSTISFSEGSPRDGSESASRSAMLEVLSLRGEGLPIVFHTELTDTSALANFLYRTCGIKGYDAIHGASAILEGAWYFVTRDDRLRRRLNTLFREWGLPIVAATPDAVMSALDAGAAV